MDLKEWSKYIVEELTKFNNRISALEGKENIHGILDLDLNKRITEQLIRSWDEYINTKTIDGLKLQDYQIRELTMLDFIKWLKNK